VACTTLNIWFILMTREVQIAPQPNVKENVRLR
jgi:hypothetical protein